MQSKEDNDLAKLRFKPMRAPQDRHFVTDLSLHPGRITPPPVRPVLDTHPGTPMDEVFRRCI